jgi:hypothetical protein
VGRLLKVDATHGFDKLTMRFKPLKSPGLMLSLSKGEAKLPLFQLFLARHKEFCACVFGFVGRQ